MANGKTWGRNCHTDSRLLTQSLGDREMIMNGKWKTVKLGDVLIQQDKSKIKAGEGLAEGLYPFYTCSNELTKCINKAIYTGPALIFGTGGNASVHYCSKDFSTSTDCIVYKSNNSEIDLNLVNKYLRENIYLLENGFKGAGLKHISRDYILSLEIPLPPLETQQKIAAVLDKVQKIISESKAILEKYDTLIKSRFIEMFGDPVANPMGMGSKETWNNVFCNYEWNNTKRW